MWTIDKNGNVVDTNVVSANSPATDPSQTQSGSGTYGSVAAATALPSAFSDLSAVYPNLTASNDAATNAVLSELQGNVSDATSKAIQDAAARYGITSGMGTSGLSKNLSLKDLGLTSEALQQQGITDYSKLLSAIDTSQTVSPETQIGLSQSNNALAAQANPQDATTYALDLYNKYLSNASTGGAATTGANTVKLAGNTGGSGTTSPFQVVGGPTNTVTPGAAGGGSGISSTGAGTYTLPTGNTYGSGDYTNMDVGSNQPTSSGSMYLGANTSPSGNNYDWETMFADLGLSF
jgi:hypothetical protein